MISKLCIFIASIIIILPVFAFSAELRIIDHKKGDGYGQQWGDRCEGLGDINGDGHGDFLVTEFTYRKLHLYLGGPSPFDDIPAITWENHGIPGGLRSFRPQNVGDIDCDGVNDFISIFSDIDTLRLFLGMENLDTTDYLVIFLRIQYLIQLSISAEVEIIIMMGDQIFGYLTVTAVLMIQSGDFLGAIY